MAADSKHEAGGFTLPASQHRGFARHLSTHAAWRLSCSLEIPQKRQNLTCQVAKTGFFFFAQQFPPLTGDARLGLAEERRGWPEPLARFSPFSSEPWRPDQMLGAIPAPSVREF